MGLKSWRNKRTSDRVDTSPSPGGDRPTRPTRTERTVREETITMPTGDPEQAQALIDSLVKAAEAQGAHVTTTVNHEVVPPPDSADK